MKSTTKATTLGASNMWDFELGIIDSYTRLTGSYRESLSNAKSERLATEEPRLRLAHSAGTTRD